MLTCRLTIKIKDYFPKTESIPYSNYICLFSCGEYQGQIPFLPDESKYLQHQIKNISSDIKYKVLILDFNDMTLIGMCEMTIAYKVLNRIMPNNGFIQEQQKKLIIDTKTKRKLFGTLINTGDIYLKIYAEVSLISKNISQQKQKIKKNHPVINTPKCYIKYNFTLNKSDFSPKSSKNNNKSTMMNSEKQTLNLSKQERENNINKYSNNNSINYKKENDNKNSLRNYSNYNIINNNINFFNKKSEADIYNNKKNIMDLLEQKKMMEEIVEKYNKSDMDEKIEIEEDYDDEYNNNNLYINNKDGYMTEQNFSNKFIKKNNNNIIKKGKNIYNFNNNINNNIINDEYNNNEDESNQKLFYYSKNTMSPNDINKKLYIDEENINMSKTLKGKNEINPNMNLINTNYVYSSKNKMIKMGKIYKKARINDNIIKNDLSKKNNDAIYQNYITNTNYTNDNTENKYNNYTQIDGSNTYTNNNIITYNNNVINSPSLKNSFEEEQDNDNFDIDRIILDKGAELRNEFQNQIRQNHLKSNNHKTINSLSNNDYLNKNYNLISNITNNTKNINYNSRTPYAEKNSRYSNSQCLNNYLTQEDVKNNCIKLIEFYSLLNLKLKKIFPKNAEIKQKLIIFEELLSSEIKKKNLIKNNLNKNDYIYNLSKNINETMNEKILSNFPKIKKIENTIYQQLFNVFSTQEELAKFSEFENYDKQTKIFLLLNLARNLVKKYGNISQIYTIKNTVNIKKKKKLKKCLQNYSITEKDVNDKDYINLENLNRNIQNRNELSEENKFKAIKEVDEDKEEENDLDEEDEKIHEMNENEQNDIKEIGDENRDQIIDDVDIIEENNICNENEKSKNEEENEKNDENLNEYINIEENGKQINNNENKNELNQESDNIINNEEKENIINNDEKNDKELDNEIDKKYIEEETKQKIENNE